MNQQSSCVSLKKEIEQMNSRLDQLDNRCKDISKIAAEKAQVEENLRDMQYMAMIQEEKHESMK